MYAISKEGEREVVFLRRKGLIMSLLIVIYAIIAVSVICPLGYAAHPPEIILERLDELKDFIAEIVEVNPRIMTVTNTAQQANALYNKINAVMMMVEEGNYMGAAKKLEKDISPKLTICDTTRVRARSWLSYDPELRDVAYEFSGMCQEMIEDILEGLTNFNG